MYDYMKALQERFDEKQPEQLVYAVQAAREGLRDGIDAESRRKLLRLLDAQNALLAESKLMSFTAGFKLAAGIAGELGAPYSFEADEEQNAKEMIVNGQETRQRRGQHPQTCRRALGGALHRRLSSRDRQADHQKRPRQDAGGMQGEAKESH